MDLFRVHAQVVQLVMKMLLAVVATVLFLAVRLVLPFVRSAVVALVRFPAVVADRHYEAQQAEVEWLLAEGRRAARGSEAPPVPSTAFVSSTTPLPASEADATATPQPDGVASASVEQATAPTSEAIEVPKSGAESAPEPSLEAGAGDGVELDEGPVLRYRPKPTSGD